jgi:ribonuclease Z
LSGYTWNLVGSYAGSFTLEVLEWGPEHGTLWAFPCARGFRREGGSQTAIPQVSPGVREVHRETAFCVRATRLDHQIPSLAYAVAEPVHVNVARDALTRLGLEPGPWVRALKSAVLSKAEGDTPIQIPARATLPLGQLLDAGAVLCTEGQKLAYVADCAWDEAKIGRAVDLCRGAHVLYCEAAFLSEDGNRARERYHLTAAQAGVLARRAAARELRIFHFSPKYRGRERELLGEAAEAFGGPVASAP